MREIFFKPNQEPNELVAEKILPFIRRQLILNKFPVKYYALISTAFSRLVRYNNSNE
jgi:hypothetical protein